MFDVGIEERLRLKLLLLNVGVLGWEARLDMARWLRVALLLLVLLLLLLLVLQLLQLLGVRSLVVLLLINRRVRCGNSVARVASLLLRWLLERRSWEMRRNVTWQRGTQRLIWVETRPGWALSSG